jgi:hypothetical protein
VNYSPIESKIWKKGKTLWAALFHFTDSEIREEYFTLEEKGKNEIKHTVDTIYGKAVSKGLLELSEAIQHRTAINNICDKLKRNLLEKILSEELIGLGYERPIKSTDNAQIIPLHVWPQKINEINWADSSISTHGIDFLNIRIIKKSALPKLENKSGVAKTKLPKPNIIDKSAGRPSQEDDLNKAFDWMIKNKRANNKNSLKAHMDELNIALAQVNPNSKYIGKLNYKTVNRHLGERFSQYKKSQN